MADSQSDALALIAALRNLLQENRAPLFASAPDCDFFRTFYRTSPKRASLSPETELPASPPPSAPEKKPVPLPQNQTPLKREPLRVETVHKADVSRSEVSSKALDVEDRFEDLRVIVTKIAPSLSICNDIPNDQEAKRLAHRWKTRNQSAPLSVLMFQELEEHRQLLSSLTLALDVVLGGARLIAAEGIEKDKQWEAFLSVTELKVVIVCDSTLWQMPNLLQFYREVPNRSERFLHQTPLFLLPDLTLYLKDPLLKRSLWKALCQKIS